MNTQTALPKLVSDKLLVHSIFPTIQTEGPFMGTPATFIRLAGCNLQCCLCDTEYMQGAKEMTILQILDVVDASPSYDLVVITGGEPFRQSAVVDLANASGRTIQFETNGTMAPDSLKWSSFGGRRPTIVCSPKTPKINPGILRHITDWKYLIRVGEVAEDGLPCCISIDLNGQPPARPPMSMTKDHIFVCPLDEGDPEKNIANLEAAALSCLKFGYRLSTQTHKQIPHLLP